MLKRFGLEAHRKKRIHQLSGGLQRRLVLARSLVADPKILFLDEPTTGFDPNSRQELWSLIGQLRDEGRGILLTTHYMDEAERLCDRILLLQDGTVIDQGSPETLIEKIAGREIIEFIREKKPALLERLNSQPALQQILSESEAVPFGEGFCLPVNEQSLKLYQYFSSSEESAVKLLRRPSNLEDVFFKLTGDRLR